MNKKTLFGVALGLSALSTYMLLPSKHTPPNIQSSEQSVPSAEYNEPSEEKDVYINDPLRERQMPIEKKSLENLINGSVIWPNYSPVKNAEVTISQQESSLTSILKQDNIEPVQTDNNGDFSFNVPYNLKYDLSARLGNLQTTLDGVHPGEDVILMLNKYNTSVTIRTKDEAGLFIDADKATIQPIQPMGQKIPVGNMTEMAKSSDGSFRLTSIEPNKHYIVNVYDNEKKGTIEFNLFPNNNIDKTVTLSDVSQMINISVIDEFTGDYLLGSKIVFTSDSYKDEIIVDNNITSINLPTETYQYRTFMGGYVQESDIISLPHDGNSLYIELEPGKFLVTGQIIDEKNRPLEAIVDLLNFGIRATTDKNGNFSEYLPRDSDPCEGDIKLRAYSKNHQPFLERLPQTFDDYEETSATDLGKIILNSNPHVITGKVTNKNNIPLDNAIVIAKNLDYSDLNIPADIAETDKDGMYTLRRIWNGNNEITAASGRISSSSVIEIDDSLDYNITLGGIAPEGMVYLPNGKNAGNGIILLEQDTAKIRQDGSFKFMHEISEGEHNLLVSTSDYRERLNIINDGNSLELRLGQIPLNYISARDELGNPINCLQIRYVDDTSTLRDTYCLNENGVYQIPVIGNPKELIFNSPGFREIRLPADKSGYSIILKEE
ncbi:MAG: carboxypeptidase-like regulatory domain-containing protein [Nanoarchaeota archaeon]|nr:carboxypeptidase-like regulatory domain-containing protein [Nanoarchaeota archaeon]